jgi:uncharacterized membrane protein required for colicin V production
MKNEDLGFSWIDLVMVGVIIAGVVRGRKRGMSEELLDVLKWLLIVVVGAFAYEQVGNFIAESTMFSRLSAYIAVYTGIILVFVLLFGFIRSQVGGKLLGSDLFGGAEYYLGMFAGGLRYACITMVALAMLNARYYNPAEVKAEIKYQEDNFGSIYFPTLCTLQHEVFAKAFLGRMTQDYLSVVLIRPTAPEEKGLGSSELVRSHERNVFDVMDKK